MSNPFVAEIRIFPFNFAPTGWAMCNGQILPISQNTALFSLLGTTYGGDGRSNFALPNLQGCAAMHPNQGPGLSNHVLGETSGSDTVTLLGTEMPAHAHTMMAVATPASTKTPSPTASLARSSGGNVFLAPDANLAAMAPNTLSPAGGGQPHNNMQPYLTFNFCIALQGVFPARS